MEIILFKNFSKRVNSTKVPADSAGTKVEVQLKQSTSRENPVFLLSNPDLTVNYVKWDDHYYFVSDIHLIRGSLYEISCTQDNLATYKSNINATVALVQYSASSYDEMLIDDRVSQKTSVSVSTAGALSCADTHGTYILSVAGKSDSAGAQHGLSSYYAMSRASLASLADYFYSQNLWTQLTQYFSDPYSSLISCKWVPWDLSTTGSKIYLADIEMVGVVGYGLGEHSVSTNEYSITIPWIYDDFRNGPTFSKMALYLPFYGLAELDVSEFVGQTTLYIKETHDNITGELVYMVWGTGRKISTFKCSLGVDVPIGQITTGQVEGIAEMVAGVATSAAGAAIGSIPTAMAGGGIAFKGLFSSMQSTTTSAGGQGALATGHAVIDSAAGSDYRKAIIYMYSFDTEQEPENLATVLGRPCYAVKTLSTLSGYVKTVNASVPMAGTQSDKDEVNQALNAGIYLE